MDIGYNKLWDKPYPVMTQSDVTKIKRDVIEPIMNACYTFMIGGRSNFKSHTEYRRTKEIHNKSMKSFDIFVVPTTPSTNVELESVIHMKWTKPDLSNLKANDFRYGHMWADMELINYATGDTEHIDRLMLDTLRAFGPGIDATYELTTPNLNDKKKLERVINKRRKKK